MNTAQCVRDESGRNDANAAPGPNHPIGHAEANPIKTSTPLDNIRDRLLFGLRESVTQPGNKSTTYSAL